MGVFLLTKKREKLHKSGVKFKKKVKRKYKRKILDDSQFEFNDKLKSRKNV
jgi:hypothetical protein